MSEQTEHQHGHEATKVEVTEIIERNARGEIIEVVEIIEIEEYGNRNEKPPRAHRYVIRLDKHKFTVQVDHMTGREILTLAGKTPPEHFKLTQKFHGGGAKTIGLDDDVDFRCHGVERFMTLPLDQTEG